jgi:hypothetical protein
MPGSGKSYPLIGRPFVAPFATPQPLRGHLGHDHYIRKFSASDVRATPRFPLSVFFWQPGEFNEAA